MLRPAMPSLPTDVKSVQAPMFFRACPHGIPLVRDVLTDWFWPINNDPSPIHTPHPGLPSIAVPRQGLLRSRRFQARRIHQRAVGN